MYECAICLTLNHSSRLHCQCCGAVPAQYSLTGNTTQAYDGYPTAIQTVIAHGAERAERYHQTHVRLRTVTLDYYATE